MRPDTHEEILYAQGRRIAVVENTLQDLVDRAADTSRAIADIQDGLGKVILMMTNLNTQTQVEQLARVMPSGGSTAPPARQSAIDPAASAPRRQVPPSVVAPPQRPSGPPGPSPAPSLIQEDGSQDHREKLVYT